VGAPESRSPPWIISRLSDDGQIHEYFRGQGLDVVYASQIRPSRKFTEVRPTELYEWARKQVPADAEAVFFGGNGLRAIGVISALGQVLGRPVLTADQACFWHALRQANVSVPVNGYGRVFEKLDAKGASSQHQPRRN
jgi:maleate isomerase